MSDSLLPTQAVFEYEQWFGDFTFVYLPCSLVVAGYSFRLPLVYKVTLFSAACPWLSVQCQVPGLCLELPGPGSTES